MTPLRRLRRPGADVAVQQLTEHNVAEVKALLANCGIPCELHEHGFLLYGERGEPRPWDWGSFLVFGDDRWDIYSDSVVKQWDAA